MEDRRQFLNPASRYRGVALWMLNDRLTKEGIAQQLSLIHI